MKRALFVAALILFCTVEAAYAISFGGPGGKWPNLWPKELDRHRKLAWTWEHGFGGLSYDIPFTDRQEFESAWPHILKLKSKGASLTLLRGPRLRVKSNKNSGVVIFLPLEKVAKGPLSHTRIHLVVDGEIVDLNRIRLPADTPINDRRFEEKPKKAARKKAPSAVTKPTTENKPASSGR